MRLERYLTIIIPLYTRYDKLLRLLLYYKTYDFPANMLILDDSPIQNVGSELRVILGSKKIRYVRYCNHLSVAEKIADGLQYVETPYAVLCADDDFLTPVGLEESVRFLEDNSEYVTAQGAFLAFRTTSSNGHIKIAWEMVGKQRSVESSDPINRFYIHLSDYTTPTFYAVHRSEVIKKVWASARDFTDDVRFGELLPTMLTALYGKIKVLNVLYAARESHPLSDGRLSKRIPDYFVEGTFHAKYSRFRECLCSTLIALEGKSFEEAQHIVETAMNNYLAVWNVSVSRLSLKVRVKKTLHLLGLLSMYKKIKRQIIAPISRAVSVPTPVAIPFIDPNHPHHDEWCRLHKIITSQG